VPATVILLGITSLLTDVSSEMVTAVLPLYLTYELSFTALQFGGFLALSELVQAVMRIGGGLASDRRSGHKGLAMTGYGLSAFSRIGILVTGGAWAPTTGVLLVDRVGKGIRTAPRDAMISLASPHGMLGRSFGVHRALDAAGALAGPLVAFAILAIASDAFDSVFIVSFAFAVVGLAVLGLFVPRTRRDVAPVGGLRRAVMRDVLRNASVRRLTIATMVLGMTTISDAFVFLSYRRVADIGFEFFPLLFTGSALVYLLLAVPAGRLADRIGRRLVFVGGFGCLALVYVSLLNELQGASGLLVVVIGLGAFYAATDGVVMAAASELLGPSTRASGLALVATGTSLGRAIAAAAFGLLWARYGPDVALWCFIIAVPVAMVIAWLLTSPTPSNQGNMGAA
jgi:MFS family permease